MADYQYACDRCGQHNPATTHFCRQCGLPLDGQTWAKRQSDQLTADAPVQGASPPVNETDRAGRPASPARSSANVGTQRPAQERRQPRRTWLPALLIAVVIVGFAAVAGWRAHWPGAVFGAQDVGRDSPVSSQSGPAPTAPSETVPVESPSVGSSAPPTTGTAQQEAVSHLAALLSQSVNDRDAIDQAYNDVMQCGPDGDQDVQAFQDAVSSRQQLLGQLQSLPMQSALSPAMLQDLSSAWHVSAQADGDYAKWAQDESPGHCVSDSTTDPNYEAAADPNRRATYYKTAFADLWNPLATQYGYPQYQQNQL